jgi:hypothetical protein
MSAVTTQSEQHDRVDKVFEDAQAAILRYWLVDLEPEPSIAVRTLGDDGRYHAPASAAAGTSLKTDRPFLFAFDVSRLTG